MQLSGPVAATSTRHIFNQVCQNAHNRGTYKAKLLLPSVCCRCLLQTMVVVALVSRTGVRVGVATAEIPGPDRRLAPC